MLIPFIFIHIAYRLLLIHSFIHSFIHQHRIPIDRKIIRRREVSGFVEQTRDGTQILLQRGRNLLSNALLHSQASRNAQATKDGAVDLGNWSGTKLFLRSFVKVLDKLRVARCR